MSFRRGVTFQPAKARVAAIFGNRPANAAAAAVAVKLTASEDKGFVPLTPEEEVSQETAMFWFRLHALPLGATIRSLPTGIPVRGRNPTERRRLAMMNASMKRRGMREGTPDTVTTYDGRAFWIELKREGSTYSALETHQRIEILRLLDSGCCVGIARCKEEMQVLFQLWGVPLRQTLPVDAAKMVTASGQRWPLEGGALRSMILQTTNPLALQREGYEPEERTPRAVKRASKKETGFQEALKQTEGASARNRRALKEPPNPSIHEKVGAI